MLEDENESYDVRPLDNLCLQISRLGARVVAITSPRRSPRVDQLARLLCTALANGDLATALIDVGDSASSERVVWSPKQTLSQNDFIKDIGGFDRLSIAANETTRPLFNNLAHLRRALDVDLKPLDRIVISLAPVLEGGPLAPSSLSVARAADAVFLMCTAGSTQTADAATAAAQLRAGGANLAGTILDNAEEAAAARQLGRAISQTRLLPASVSSWLARVVIETPA